MRRKEKKTQCVHTGKTTKRTHRHTQAAREICSKMKKKNICIYLYVYQRFLRSGQKRKRILLQGEEQETKTEHIQNKLTTFPDFYGGIHTTRDDIGFISMHI